MMGIWDSVCHEEVRCGSDLLLFFDWLFVFDEFVDISGLMMTGDVFAYMYLIFVLMYE